MNAKTRPKRCRCIAKINKKLEGKGVELTTAIAMDFDNHRASIAGPFIVLNRIGGGRGKKMPTLVCAYCPFCGKKMEAS